MVHQSNKSNQDSCSDSSTSSSDSSVASHGQAPTPPPPLPLLRSPQQQQQSHEEKPFSFIHEAHTPCEAKQGVAVIPVSHVQGAELGFQPQPQDLSISLDFLKQSTQQAVQQQQQQPVHINTEATPVSPWSPDDTPLEAAPAAASPHGRPFVARSRSSAPAPGSALGRHAQSASLNFLVPSGGSSNGEAASLTPPSPPYGSSVGSSNFGGPRRASVLLGDERDARQRSISRDAQQQQQQQQQQQYSASLNAARHALPWNTTGNGTAAAELSPAALDSASPASDYFLDQRQVRADGAAFTSLALGRSASASRAQPPPPIFAPWAAEEAWRSGEEAWQNQEGARPQSIMSDASRNQSRRPPFVGRSHSVNVGMAFGARSHSSSFEPGSPASFGGLESPGGRSATASSPHVGALPTMHEEWSFDAPHHSGSYASREDMAARASRHRSTSSAAAIPFHSSRGGGAMEHDVSAARTRSSSVWAGGASPAYASRYMGGSGAASLDELEDLGHDGDERSGDKTAMQSPVSRGRDYRAPGGPRLETDSSNTSPFVRDGTAALGRHYDDDDLGVPHGTESRRHSISAAPGAGGAPLASRRAVGFEVAGQGSRTGSVGRHPSHMPSSSRAGGGYGLFGGGSLAISDDDLAADLNTLQLNLDHVAERQQEQEQASRQVSMRVPSSAAAATGAHAASMPPRFGEPSGAFDFASPATGGHSPWSNTRGRTGDIAASWDLHTPAAASPTHHRDIRAMSVGGPFSARPSGHVRERSASNVSESSAARSSEAKYTLSPRAKAFNLAGMGAIGTGASPQGGYDQNLPAHSPSQAQFGAPLPPAQQMPYAQGTHRRNPSSASSMNYPQQVQQQPLMRPAGPGTLQPLSETAFASLASLGPMPMTSGGGPGDGPASLQELGKGVPLHTLPRTQPLYLCAFKADRTDIFFRQPPHPGAMPAPDGDEEIRKGDLVVVEGDRGKDIGTVVNCSITVEQVEHFLAHQNELLALAGKGDGAAGTARQARTINPKRLYYKATGNEIAMLPSKANDEERALQLIQTKVLQRGLPMQVVAAEFQWDHRKLTFYYHSTARVDFRELVKEVFRLYKTRIWMVNLNHGAT